MAVKMFHNPKCSKSRETLALLREKGIEPEVREYLQSPPDATELQQILTLLDLKPRQLMRTKENVYREKNLHDDKLGDAELIDAMVADPILIERPIVFANGKAAIGRPPENILEIL